MSGAHLLRAGHTACTDLTSIVLFNELSWSHHQSCCELCPILLADIHWHNSEFLIFHLYWDLSACRRTHLDRGSVRCSPEMVRATSHLRISWTFCRCSVSKLQGTSKSFMHLRYMVRIFLFLFHDFLRLHLPTGMKQSFIAKQNLWDSISASYFLLTYLYSVFFYDLHSTVCCRSYDIWVEVSKWLYTFW